MNPEVTFDRHVLEFDCAAASEQIEKVVRETVSRRLRRQGAVVGVSGGVDSAVCAALAARALGQTRVLALLMPERDSSDGGTERARALCGAIGIDHILEDITPILEGAGCYRRRDEAIRRLFPDFSPGYRSKIAAADDLLERDRINYFNLIVESPDGRLQKMRMPADVYLQVVAATNLKQRTRKMLEYYHAERLNYAVIGTPNRAEYELGFFVRGGDGLADLKPIAHLYKTQVYELASYLRVSGDICRQIPSTDTYSLPQTQQEFYFGLPYDLMDLLLYAFSNGVAAKEAAKALDLGVEQVERAYRDIVAKQRMASSLHQAPLLVEDMNRRTEVADTEVSVVNLNRPATEPAPVPRKGQGPS